MLLRRLPSSAVAVTTTALSWRFSSPHFFSTRPRIQSLNSLSFHPKLSLLSISSTSQITSEFTELVTEQSSKRVRPSLFFSVSFNFYWENSFNTVFVISAAGTSQAWALSRGNTDWKSWRYHITVIYFSYFIYYFLKRSIFTVNTINTVLFGSWNQLMSYSQRTRGIPGSYFTISASKLLR